MWLFDWFRPSSNFAKWIKLICNELNIEVSVSSTLKWNEQRRMYSYSGDIISWNISNPGININIARDIFKYLQSRYAWHEKALMMLDPVKQDELLIKLYWDRDILDFTYDVMNKSVLSQWLNPNQIFWDKDIRIINEIYWS